MADPIIVTYRPFHFNRRSYEWRQVGQNWELTTAGQVVAQVVPDALHPGMYRVDLGDDPLSDMVRVMDTEGSQYDLSASEGESEAGYEGDESEAEDEGDEFEAREDGDEPEVRGADNSEGEGGASRYGA